mmetsp:Transcript_26512/g.71001  ORF Transcript_26512/g.71001 Transcript_26512/m.71001 type:complete len:247 (+) Transcript_26512:853-1593(+)
MADVSQGYTSWQAFGDNRNAKDHSDNTGYFFIEGFVDNRYRVFSSLFYVYPEAGPPTSEPTTYPTSTADGSSVSSSSSASATPMIAMGAGAVVLMFCLWAGAKAGLCGSRRSREGHARHAHAEPASWMDGWAEAIGITPVQAVRAPEGPANGRVVEAVAIEMSKPRGTLAVAEVIEDDMILGGRPDSAMGKVARDVSRQQRRGSSLGAGATGRRGRKGATAFQELVRRYSGSGEHEVSLVQLLSIL